MELKTREAVDKFLAGKSGKLYEQESLKSACHLVERELRRMRTSDVTFDYSEGCYVHGAAASSRAISLYEAIRGLQKKLDDSSTK